jgi:hypothetical protein
MDADIKGCLRAINKSYRIFEYKGKRMSKEDVRKVLTYGLDKGYTSVSEISEKEISEIIGY